MASTQYNRIIRKLVIGFGNLFDKITLVRYKQDMKEQERFIVPLAYAAKEDYVMRIQGDPNLDKKVQMTLPRMSFLLNGMTYDSSRKLNTNIKNFAQTTNGTISQYNPVPYDFDFSLFLYVRNIEDGTQLLEHIIPFFTPDYTIKLNLIPEMGIVKEIPIKLNSIDMPVDYEGGRDRETRIIIWTLNFTVKGYIFGATSDTGLIKTSITNIFNKINTTDEVTFNMSNVGTGNYQTDEIVYQGYSLSNATATGKVVTWNPPQLVLSGLYGNFVSSQQIIGSQTNSSYPFETYQVGPQQLVQVIATTNPTDANTNTPYTYTTQISETPYINNNITQEFGFAGDLTTEFGRDDLQTEQENQIDLGN
jgi:hypothetical protein